VPAPNWANRSLWTGDNLPILRGMNTASVDLIYLDPPFNSKRDYAAPIGSEAAGAEFKDTWSLSDIDAEWANLIEAKHPHLYRVLLAAMTASDKSYLIYMAARLLELHRVLKPTGSIYLHCDPTMGAYLKLLMDAVFGRRRFRNEIVWKRFNFHADAKRFGTITDRLLFYAAGDECTSNPVRVPYSAEYIASKFRHEDGDGRRFRLDNLNPPGGRGPVYEFHGVTKAWRMTREKMEALDAEGRIYTKSRVPQLKRYLDEMPGQAVPKIWTDVPPINPAAKERVGYPTQKPLALLRRIVAASSNEGDIVLDPFAGCATACIAAEDLGREWGGIDVSAKAAELVRFRLYKEVGWTGEIAHRTDIPKRTDLGKLPPYRSHKPTLYGLQSGNCAGCGTHFEARHFEVDHIIARGKGGTDHIDNLQLLCGHCNSVKGDRGMEYLMSKLQLQ